jgi:hypothetical protein
VAAIVGCSSRPVPKVNRSGGWEIRQVFEEIDALQRATLSPAVAEKMM